MLLQIRPNSVALEGLQGRTPSGQERARAAAIFFAAPTEITVATFSSAPLCGDGYQRWSGWRQ
jgi:hypothetical protein